MNVFLSSAAEDIAHRDALVRHLDSLRRMRRVRLWHDGLVDPGDDVTAREELERAELVLLLVSADYLASDACMAELDRALDRVLDHALNDSVRVVPILLRPCWIGTELVPRTYRLPADGQPVTMWADRDAAWTNVVKGIASLVDGAPSSFGRPQLTAGKGPNRVDSERLRLVANLEDARVRRRRVEAQGIPTREVDGEILALKRQLREGGQLRQGDILGGRYSLLHAIGRGGFARVWEAEDREEHTRVAVKVLHTDLVGDVTRYERFFRGARAMSLLRHEAIVRVLAPQQEDAGYHYFVMELLAGGDLQTAVLEGKLPAERVVPLILRIGEALTAAHEHPQHFIHRDVKPANILLDENGDPKLSDFDLVAGKDTTGGTRTGPMGSFVYAAQEMMLRPQDADVRADVFGLGMTALFCLHGKPLTTDAVYEPQPLLAEIGRPAVSAVIAKAIARNAALRFADVRSFCAALRDAAESERADRVGAVIAPPALDAQPKLVTVQTQPTDPAREVVPPPLPDTKTMPAAAQSKGSDRLGSDVAPRAANKNTKPAAVMSEGAEQPGLVVLAPPVSVPAVSVPAVAKKPPRSPWSVRLRAAIALGIVLVSLGSFQLYRSNRTAKMRVFVAEAATVLHTGGPESISDAEKAIASAKDIDATSRAVALGLVRVRMFAALEWSPESRDLQRAITDAKNLGVPASDLAAGEIVALLTSGNITEATELVTHNDEDPERAGDALFQMTAGALLEMSDPAAAIERYRAAVKIDADYLSIQIRLARALAFSGQGVEASELLQALRAKWPGRPELSALAAVLAAADPALAASAKLDPATDIDALPLSLRAAARALANRSDEHVILQAAREADIAPVVVLCGEVALRGGHEAAARAAARSALERMSSYAPAHGLIARTALALALFEEATQEALRGPQDVAAEVLSFIAYEADDRQRMVSAAEGRANGPLTDPISAGVARLRGAKPLDSTALASLAKSGRFWADIVAMDGALDAGDLDLAQTIASGWVGGDKHPIRASRVARLLRYQGKSKLAQTAASSATTLAARVEGALAAAEIMGGRKAAIEKLEPIRAPEVGWVISYLLARADKTKDAHAALDGLPRPDADAPLLLRRVAALALTELDKDKDNPTLAMYSSLDVWRRNPDVARALRAY